jgi:hypothetical protein
MSMCDKPWRGCVYRQLGTHSLSDTFTALFTQAGGHGGSGARSVAPLGYEALEEEGLVNKDEWEQILGNEARGMPRYLSVMYWVEVRPPSSVACTLCMRQRK